MSKVLVAEDDALLASILLRHLESAGFEVHRAVDGEQTLKTLGEWLPDLILLDILMPQKDGFEVLEDMQKNPQFASMKVVVLTNYGSKEDREKAKKYKNVLDYLLKAEASPTEITEKVKALLT